MSSVDFLRARTKGEKIMKVVRVSDIRFMRYDFQWIELFIETVLIN